LVLNRKKEECKGVIFETFRGSSGFTLNEIAEAIAVPEEDIEIFTQAAVELRKEKSFTSFDC
jgi:hypothetical protein